jgi:hypothetical protein
MKQIYTKHLLWGRGLPLVATIVALLSLPARAEQPARSLFDGKSLDGWEVLESEADMWKVIDGAITAGSLYDKVPHNSFVSSRDSFQNFDLRLKVRLLGTEGFVNSGIQIRSVRLPNNHEMFGYQVDAGKGWWGKLYDESRRRTVIGEADDLDAVNKAIDEQGWNEFRILAEGRRIRSWINGVPALDYSEADTTIPLDGYIGLLVHGGGKTVVQFKDVTIQELPPTPDAPTWKSVGLPKAGWPKGKRPQ